MLKLDDRRGSVGACVLRALVAGAPLLLAACVYDVLVRQRQLVTAS